MDPKVVARFSAAPPLDEPFLRAELARAEVALEPGARPFVDAAELERRYGVALPADLRALWHQADRRMIEQADLSGFRYVRMALGGWEPPPTEDVYPYFGTTISRFDWNTFSNMQFLERLCGLAPLGWDDGDNRLEVATAHPDAPVFWLDHETADLLAAGCVARSLDDFLRVKIGDEAGLDNQALALARDGSHWTRDTDGYPYLECEGPLHQWPPFLWSRHGWIVAELCFGSAEEQLAVPEVLTFDFDAEAPLVVTSEPLALYWLLRSLLLEEEPTLAEAATLTAEHASPLVRALSRFARETPRLNPEGVFAKARKRAAAYRARFRSPDGFDAKTF